MRVLVTGGYGFIGSHVAEKFYKEGYEVSIIDNLSTGNVKNLKIKHKAYHMDVEDKKCDEIFRMNRFDIVIHFAAQNDELFSVDNPFVDAKTNILGLLNMLELSVKYKIKKFIFASSAAVYGNNTELPLNENSECNPLTPFAINKYMGEYYCNKWNELYKLNTICLRFSEVYGPGQGFVGERSIVEDIMEKTMKNQQIILYGDGNQKRDFIYVSDAAEAVFGFSEDINSGIYNISSNTQNSINDIIETVNDFQQIKGKTYMESRKGFVSDILVDNTKAKKNLDWIPMYDLKKGLKLTYKWYKENYQKTEVVKPKNNNIKNAYNVLVPYIENVLIFILVILIENFLKSDSVFRTIDPAIIYIILVGIYYGTKQSIIAVALSGILYIVNSLNMGKDYLSMIYDTGFVFHLGVYILIGIFTGYVIDSRNARETSDKEKYDTLEYKYDFLNELYNETFRIKSQLQDQILNSEDSFGRTYEIIRELDSLEPQHVFKAALGVLENILKTDKVAIYTVDKKQEHIRLEVKSSKENFIIPKTLNLKNFSEVKEKLIKGEIYINKEFKADLPLMIAPVIDNDKLVVLLMVYNVDFDKFTLYYQNLFKIVTNLISLSVIRAYKYQHDTVASRYINNTILLKSEFFNNMLELEKEEKSENMADYTLLSVKEKTKNYSELSEAINKCIRETDIAGVGSDGGIYILLTNSNKFDSKVVIERLEDFGVKVEIK